MSFFLVMFIFIEVILNDSDDVFKNIIDSGILSLLPVISHTQTDSRLHRQRPDRPAERLQECGKEKLESISESEGNQPAETPFVLLKDAVGTAPVLLGDAEERVLITGLDAQMVGKSVAQADSQR